MTERGESGPGLMMNPLPAGNRKSDAAGGRRETEMPGAPAWKPGRWLRSAEEGAAEKRNPEE